MLPPTTRRLWSPGLPFAPARSPGFCCRINSRTRPEYLLSLMNASGLAGLFGGLFVGSTPGTTAVPPEGRPHGGPPSPAAETSAREDAGPPNPACRHRSLRGRATDG